VIFWGLAVWLEWDNRLRQEEIMSADEPGGPVVTGPLARYEVPFRAYLVQGLTKK
jgi:hypothetical protein